MFVNTTLNLSKTGTVALLLALVACNGKGNETGDTDTIDTSDADTDTDTDADTDADTDTDTNDTDWTTPTVLSTLPFDAAIAVHLDLTPSATFSEAMDLTTLTPSTFMVTTGDPPIQVDGTVLYADDLTAVFTPTVALASGTTFEATVTTGAESANGVGLAHDYLWTFTTAATPTVLFTSPLDLAPDVPLNLNVTATFSEPMDFGTIDGATFTVVTGNPAVPVPGTVIYASNIATFWPAGHLAANTAYLATVTTGAESANGVALAEAYDWTFTTGTALAAGLPVNLGTAGTFAVLAKSGISTVPASVVTRDIGVSPAAATYITGFSLAADLSNVFALSPQVTGHVFAADYAVPTPSNMTTAIGDMELAFTDAAGRAPDFTEHGAGAIGGMTLAPGVYKWGTGVLVASDVTLNGSATDVWIFQIAQDLTLSSGAAMHLTGGALPMNVFWQVAGLVDFGTTAHGEGNVLTQTSATLHTGASINGRLLAQTAVSLDQSVVVEPAP